MITAKRGKMPVALLLLLLLSGCGYALPDAVVAQFNRPAENATTHLTSALPCMGRQVTQGSILRLIIVPNVRDGDASPAGLSPGLGPRLLANPMLVAAVQSLNTPAVLTADSLPAARERANRAGRQSGTRAQIIIIDGGTLVQPDVAGQGGEIRASPLPFSSSAGIDRGASQFYMALTVLDEDLASIPGMSVEMNAYAERSREQLRIGLGTSTYDVSLTGARFATSVSSAQVSQSLFQAGAIEIVGKALGADPAACLSQARRVAENHARGASLDHSERETIADRRLVELGFLRPGPVDSVARTRAIAAFQRQAGRVATGSLDAATFADLVAGQRPVSPSFRRTDAPVPHGAAPFAVRASLPAATPGHIAPPCHTSNTPVIGVQDSATRISMPPNRNSCEIRLPATWLRLKPVVVRQPRHGQLTVVTNVDEIILRYDRAAVAARDEFTLLPGLSLGELRFEVTS